MSTYNARVPAHQQYQIIMECRSSGLTDYQWCKEHGTHPGTFYNWVSRLRKKACYDIPDPVSRDKLIPSAAQEVVRLDISPKTESAAPWGSSPTERMGTGLLPTSFSLPLTRLGNGFRQVSLLALLRLENDFRQTRHIGNYKNHKMAAVILLSLPTKPARGKVAGNAATFFLRFNTDKIQKRRMAV